MAIAPSAMTSADILAAGGDPSARRLAGVGIGTVTNATVPKFYAGLQRVRGRTGRARWGFAGDSLTKGDGANSPSGPGNGSNPSGAGNASRTLSLPGQLSGLLSAAGIPTRADGVLGTGSYNGYTNADAVAYNPLLTLGADWSCPAGGRNFLGATTGTTALTYTPSIVADTFDIVYGRNTGLATFTVSDASGVLATINADGAFGNVIATVKRAVASTLPITIQRTGVGGQLLLQGILPSLSFLPALEIINMGQSGITAAQYATTSGQLSLPNALITLGLDLTTIELGANDTNQGVSASSFQGSYNTLAALVKPVSDLGLIKTHKAQTTGTGYDLPAAYLAAIDAVASANGAAFVADFNGGLALSTGSGDYYDAIHLSAQGYRKEAVFLANLVLSLL